MDKTSLNYVRFDVGSHLYLCHRSTIEKFPDSILAKCISAQFDKRESENDFIVIDRDGKHFGTILNYMRDQSYLELYDWNESDIKYLIKEADYYCLTDLIDDCQYELERRTQLTNSSKNTETAGAGFSVPNTHKMLVIFGSSNMQNLLNSLEKPTVIVNYNIMAKYDIVAWVEQMLNFLDHEKFDIYCFADYNSFSNINEPSCIKGYLVAFCKPKCKKFALSVTAPTIEKFQAHKSHYKCKLFQFLLQIQYNNSKFEV